MKIFVDTGAWIALADKHDQHHQAAQTLYGIIQQNNIALLITDYVFDETVTWLHYKINHDVACTWGNNILNSRMVEMLTVNEMHIQQAWELFQTYHDQKFSFTDCVSFVVMDAFGISVVFGYDAHFSTMNFHLIGEVSDESVLTMGQTSKKKRPPKKKQDDTL